MILIVMIATEADLVTDMGVLSTDFNLFNLVLGQCILYSLKKCLILHTIEIDLSLLITVQSTHNGI